MEMPADEATPARLTRMPSWLINQNAIQAHRLVAEGLAAIDARVHHYRLLVALAEKGPDSQAALGRRSGIHLSDVVAAINELADRGMVQRTPDPADRRRNIITITAAGREQLRLLDQRLAQVQDELMAPLTGQERDQLVGLLARVLAHHVERARGQDAGGR
jgi:MarR family transcriptional regulator, lower aerobic nicotinate degradation pathway regulator